MMTLNDYQKQIYSALHQQALAETELQDAQAAYEAKFAEFEASNPELVARRNTAIHKHTEANKALRQAREATKVLLSSKFMDELPEGFKQNQGKDVIYDPQGFHKQALASFPFLLKLDHKAVSKFFTAMADKQTDGSFILPENIRSLASVEVISTPSPIISNATIKKLEFEPEADLSVFEDALEETTKDNSPVDEKQANPFTMKILKKLR